MNKLPIIVPYIYDARYHAYPYILSTTTIFSDKYEQSLRVTDIYILTTFHCCMLFRFELKLKEEKKEKNKPPYHSLIRCWVPCPSLYTRSYRTQLYIGRLLLYDCTFTIM